MSLESLKAEVIKLRAKADAKAASPSSTFVDKVANAAYSHAYKDVLDLIEIEELGQQP